MSATTLAPTGAGALRNTFTIARRNLLHIKANPEQLIEMSIQPLMFLVLFVYVFGGAIAGSSSEYLQFALPGIIVQGLAFTPFTTALGLHKDFQGGLIDRFRSLPISRSSPIAGRITADGFRILWSLMIMLVFGVILGFRFHEPVLNVIAGAAVAISFGLTMCWPMAFIGVTATSVESVNSWGFMLILPITFVSSVFVPVESMPGWLEAFAEVNPITHVVDSVRGLMLGGQAAQVESVGASTLYALLWFVGIVAVFAPLTIAKYRRRV
jgi:ABC-2 type transport system permease protein/oleandomycin transport system permease protein